jgi:hypothetical protein
VAGDLQQNDNLCVEYQTQSDLWDVFCIFTFVWVTISCHGLALQPCDILHGTPIYQAPSFLEESIIVGEFYMHPKCKPQAKYRL